MKYILLMLWLFITGLIMVSFFGAIAMMLTRMNEKWFDLPEKILDYE